MRNRSSLWPIATFALVLSLLLSLSLVLAACGQAAVANTSAKQAVTLPPGETLYLVDSAGGGYGQHLVAVQPTSAAPAALMALPAGLAAPDHSVLYTATANTGGGTTVARVNPLTGTTLLTLTLASHYTISGDGWGDATLSADGRWLAMERADSGGATSVFTLVDTQTMKAARTFTLGGAFALDAIANGGRMLYLLQNLNDAARHYYVRAYDAQAGQLIEGYIVDKTELDETWNMAGYAMARQEASDGSVDYTLYIAPGQKKAFIHALPLSNDPNGGLFAHCIDLPGGSPDLLRYYTLAMSPDGTTLYAANTALGVVVRVSLHGGSSNVFSDQVTAMGPFASGVSSVSNVSGQASQRPLYNGAALSRDGKTLYVSGPNGVSAFDAGTLALRKTYLAGQDITSVAVGAGSQTLYAVNPSAGVRVIDLASGQTLRTARGPMQSPWGIAWVQA